MNEKASEKGEDLEVGSAEVINGSGDPHVWRKVAVWLLIVLGSILLFVANPMTWARDVLLDTDTWVDTVGPLSQSPVVADAISQTVVDRFVVAIVEESEVESLVPAEMSFLVQPIIELLQESATDLISETIQSEEFNEVWRGFNRIAHQVVISALAADNPVLYVQDGQLILDLNTIVGAVLSELGFNQLAQLGGQGTWAQIVLLEDVELVNLQRSLAVIDRLAGVTALLSFVSFGLAILISLWRKRTIIHIGIALMVSMIMFLLVLYVIEPLALTSFQVPGLQVVLQEMWRIVTRGLVTQTFLIILIGLLMTLIAWFSERFRLGKTEEI
jgi:hypothetical protein